MAGPGHHDKLDTAHHVLPSMPGSDVRKGVRADDEEEGLVGGDQALDRVDRITFLDPGFDAGRLKTGVGPTRQLDHAKAVFKRRTRLLMRRIASWNKEDPVERKSFGCFVGHDEVGGMDRIEGAAEDGYPHNKR